MDPRQTQDLRTGLVVHACAALFLIGICGLMAHGGELTVKSEGDVTVQGESLTLNGRVEETEETVENGEMSDDSELDSMAGKNAGEVVNLDQPFMYIFEKCVSHKIQKRKTVHMST